VEILELGYMLDLEKKTNAKGDANHLMKVIPPQIGGFEQPKTNHTKGGWVFWFTFCQVFFLKGRTRSRCVGV